MNNAPLFFLVAGEASGDLLGARLMAALKKKTDGAVRFAGVGGPRMREEGIELLFDQAELAHMGLFEIIRHLPNILRRLRETVQAVKERRPAALVTIDSPDFSFRVAKKLKGEGIPLIHYVAPTVWAWRPGRARKIAAFLDHLLALLPFEPPYFTRHGLACSFVGHPLVETDAGKGSAARFRERFFIPEGAPVLAVLPGSRMGEVKRLLPVFREAVVQIHDLFPSLHIVVPTVPGVEAYVRAAMRNWPIAAHFTDNDRDKYDAFAAATAALACSGTVSVELAMAEVPTVIAYRANPLTVALYRRFIKTKYATLLNIMQGRAVMPEFLQENCTAENLSRAVETFLVEKKERERQKSELHAIGAWLGRGQFVPSEKAAQAVWNAAFRRPLRVLQLIPSLGTGGAEQACVDVAAALALRGDAAFVVSTGGWRVAALEESGAAFIKRDVKTKNPLKIVWNGFWLAFLIREKRIDIVHARSRAPAWSAKIACRLTGCRFVTTFHAAYKFSCGLKKAYNSVMVKADRVIAISSFVARHIEGQYGVGEEKARLVNRGVDVRAFDPQAVSEDRKRGFAARAGLRMDEKAILLPGRLSPIKGQDVFIRAVGKLKERGLSFPPVLIVGDDQGRESYAQKLRKLICENGLEGKIRLIGACADMAAAYAFASLVVAPSQTPEGFGRVPVEAMAMGVPVVASDLGAMSDTILEGITGWLVPPDNVDAWAEAVSKALVLGEEDRRRMAQTARDRAVHFFAKETMIEKTLAVYDELRTV